MREIQIYSNDGFNGKQGCFNVDSRPTAISRWMVAYMLLIFCLPQQVCLSCAFASWTTTACTDSNCQCNHSQEQHEGCPNDCPIDQQHDDDGDCPRCMSRPDLATSTHGAEVSFSTCVTSWIQMTLSDERRWTASSVGIWIWPPSNHHQLFHTRI
jgi:hypothetical protein